MTTAELVSQVAESTKLTKTVTLVVVKAIAGAIHKSLKDTGLVRVNGLGTFKILHVKAKRGFNPRTKAHMTIPAMRLPRFKPAKALKEAVQGSQKKAPKKAM